MCFGPKLAYSPSRIRSFLQYFLSLLHDKTAMVTCIHYSTTCIVAIHMYTIVHIVVIHMYTIVLRV